MTNEDRQLLVKVAERTAWMKGKLEEVHLRTAEIPRLVEEQQKIKGKVSAVVAAVVLLFALTAPEVFAFVRTILP